MAHTIYFKRKGKKIKAKLNGLQSDLKENLQDLGLKALRASVAADEDSPIMVIAK